MDRFRKYRNITGLLCALLTAALLAGCGATPVEVFDGVNTIPIFPASGVPVSTLTAEDFIADQDGIPVCKNSGYETARGIDISEFQGDIDWEAVAGSNVQFVFLRCGYRGASEGALSRDAKFEENFEQASAAGLQVGVYFYSQAVNAEEAREEADLVKEMLIDRTPDLPVMFDWERNDTVEGSRTYNADGETVTDAAAAFCEVMEEAGYTPGVYMNLNTGYHTWDLSRLRNAVIWLSDPSDYPRFYYQAEYWQYSFTGTVPGIEGECDLDMRLTPKELE